MVTVITKTDSLDTDSALNGRLRALPATEEDRHFVRHLLSQTLFEFYDGDHIAHADRILNAHLAAGRDTHGHFSFGQRTLVLWAGGGAEAERIGLLHLVSKRQETVKISPLILHPAHRSRSGLGTMLLEVAEEFAVKAGARQLYCTVAESNEAALGFFLRNGFVIAGHSVDQYKSGVREIMMYRNIDAAAVRSKPGPEVEFRLFQQKDYLDLRSLVLNTLAPFFRGMDNRWIESLVAGHHRRHGEDLNEKYKVIHVAVDAQDAVRGVVAAGPKKGEPIKVMPMCADSPAVFGRLVEEVPNLFGRLGRKLYTHLPSEPVTTARMQRSGWRLEGLLPSAYHPDFCTLQWGLPLNTEKNPKGETRE